MIHCLDMLCFVCLAVISCSDAFTVSSRTLNEVRYHGTSALEAEGGTFPFLPFFAKEESPGENVPSGGTASVTTRLPVGTIFDSRDYIFTTITNVRSYEWKRKQVDELFDDLYDAAFQEFILQGDYELGQIVIVPMEWDTEAYGIGGKYDVYDGQQRLVTMCMLISAFRESFRGEYGMKDTVQELDSMLNPPKMRKQPIRRIELRGRDNQVLRQIIDPDELGNSITKEQATGSTNRRILKNYERLVERVSTLTKDDRVKMVDFMLEKVHMLVCTPESGAIARNIVMGQGKGMDNEPIDDFKGLVCFRYALTEDDMYLTFDQWDELATGGEEISSDDTNTGVGREIISAACRLRSMAALRSKIGKNNEEVKALELWLRQALSKNESWEGREFFVEEIRPASKALKLFRDGNFDFSSSWSTVTLQRTISSRLRFLRYLTQNVACTKEIEMVVLELLLRVEGKGVKRGPKLSIEKFDKVLSVLELKALQIALTKPSPAKRLLQCFEILDAIDGSSSIKQLVESTIADSEKINLGELLLSSDLGASTAGKKVAAAVLERLNTHVLIKERASLEAPNTLYVEQILPKKASQYWETYWPEEELRQLYINKLVNMCLLSTRPKTTAAFSKKKERYVNEPWPLTNHISTYDEWNPKALGDNIVKLDGLIQQVWGLKKSSSSTLLENLNNKVSDRKQQKSKVKKGDQSEAMPLWAKDIVKGKRIEYYWDNELQWCSAEVIEDPVLKSEKEIMVQLKFHDDEEKHSVSIRNADKEEALWRLL